MFGALREVANEIVIGAHDPVGGESDLAWYGSIANDLVTIPFLRHVELQRGWLMDTRPDMSQDRMIAAYRLLVWWITPPV